MKVADYMNMIYVVVDPSGVIIVYDLGGHVESERAYRYEDLPPQIQEKLAVLSLLSPEIAGRSHESTVPGLGGRIKENTFWLYVDEGTI
jgi:hypothetical protein